MPPGPPGPPGPTGPPGPAGIPPWPPGPPPIIPWGGADIGPIGTPPGCDIDMGGIPLALLALPGGPVELFTGGGPTLGGPWFDERPGGALPGPPPLLSGPTGVPEPLPCVEP